MTVIVGGIGKREGYTDIVNEHAVAGAAVGMRTRAKRGKSFHARLRLSDDTASWRSRLRSGAGKLRSGCRDRRGRDPMREHSRP